MKDDLSECRNYRGIMLLSIVSKVLTNVSLSRINAKLDATIRKEQTSFRANLSFVDQINTLRIILEQCNEWRITLHLLFMDYFYAFDTISRSCIFEALHKRGIAPKSMNLIRAEYEGFKCRVSHNGLLFDSFVSSSVVRQSCLMSPILFLITLYEVLRAAVRGSRLCR